jgi:hypothetical protein
MTLSKRLRLAISLASLLGALAFVTPAMAAPGSWSGGHHDGGHGDFHHDGHGHDHFGLGFGFGFGDPWWGWGGGWGPAYWGYPYAPYYPYYYPPPYPAYYPPPGSPEQGVPPQGAVPQASPQAMAAPQPQFWYYCDNPQGYYPHVTNCSSAWHEVAATPPAGSLNTITPNQKP